jgi:pimeloyl-ACP methyl ester carboxylesterase
MTILTELRAGRTFANVPEPLAPLFRPSVQPYLISQLNLDPAQAIGAVRAPTLIMQGGHDLQVGVTDAQRLRAARPDARLVILDGVNHVLKDAPAERGANLATYADPALPLNPAVVSLITEFVRGLPAES